VQDLNPVFQGQALQKYGWLCHKKLQKVVISDIA